MVISLLSTAFIAFLMSYALIITILGSRKVLVPTHRVLSEFPQVSVVIPVKDEFKVLRESLSRLMAVNYPLDRLKVYVGVDVDCKECLDVCRGFSPYVVPVLVSSRSKPAVLNELLHLVSSEYVLLLDCDSLITPESVVNLLNAVMEYGVCGATGIPRPSNLCSGILPKFFLVETALWQKLTVSKNNLGLIVQAPGYFTLFKRSCVEAVGYWDEGSLAEDNDITLRIYASGGRIKLVNSVVYVESPVKLRTLIKQRVRWYRGTLEVLRKRWGLLRKMSLKLRLDALVTFASPISPTLFLVAMISNALLGGVYNLLTLALIIPQIITPLIVGEGLEIASRVKLAALTLPYVIVNAIASLIAVITLVARIRIGWWRTEKCGYLGGCSA